MIFRALIAIGIVSLLTPHEPDLGFGRPGAGASHPSPASLLSASGLSRKQECGIPVDDLGSPRSPCPPEKRPAIKQAFRHFGLLL